jgi:ABC-type multidrug transport system ATPase subunit
MTQKELVWKNILYEKINEDKEITREYVDGLSGKAVSGRIIAIMGASDAGKTNLFDVLIGGIPSTSRTYGDITYDGTERKQKTWLKKISFLQQNNIYDKNLTIYETMM